MLLPRRSSTWTNSSQGHNRASVHTHVCVCLAQSICFMMQGCHVLYLNMTTAGKEWGGILRTDKVSLLINQFSFHYHSSPSYYSTSIPPQQGERSGLMYHQKTLLKARWLHWVNVFSLLRYKNDWATLTPVTQHTVQSRSISTIFLFPYGGYAI